MPIINNKIVFVLTVCFIILINAAISNYNYDINGNYASIFMSAYANNNEISAKRHNKELNETGIIGGFGAPIFFDNFSSESIEQKINEIANTATKIKKIELSYPKQLKSQAFKIKNKICKLKQYKKLCANNGKQKTAFIYLSQLQLQDDDQVKYRHDAVIATLFF